MLRTGSGKVGCDKVASFANEVPTLTLTPDFFGAALPAEPGGAVFHWQNALVYRDLILQPVKRQAGYPIFNMIGGWLAVIGRRPV
jgi:hypothetical protein